MQRAKTIAGLTKNRDQGGGVKKQGLPSTTGSRTFIFNMIKRESKNCCLVLK